MVKTTALTRLQHIVNPDILVKHRRKMLDVPRLLVQAVTECSQWQSATDFFPLRTTPNEISIAG